MKHHFIFTLSTILLLTSCSSSDSWFGGEKKLDLVGERISLISLSEDLKKDGAKALQQMKLSPALHNKIFNSFDSENGKNFHLSEIIKEAYSVNFNSSNDFNLVTTPVIADNRLFIMNSTGSILCYELATGVKLWQNDEFYNLTHNSFFKNYYLNGGIYYANNKIIATAGINKVISVDAKDGKTLWQEDLSGAVRATPIEMDGKIHLKSIDNKVYTLNAENGKAEWSFLNVNEDVNVLNAIGVKTNKNLLITYNNSDEVIALNRTSGEEIWATSVADSFELTASQKSFFNIEPLTYIYDEQVYISDKHGDLSSLDIATGDKIWKKRFNITKRFWICGDFIFAVSNNKNLIAIDRHDGAIKWIVTLPIRKKETKLIWSSPIVINSKVAVTNTNGSLLFLSVEDGTVLKEMNISKDVRLPPVIVDGNMLIVSDQGRATYYSK